MRFHTSWGRNYSDHATSQIYRLKAGDLRIPKKDIKQQRLDIVDLTWNLA